MVWQNMVLYFTLVELSVADRILSFQWCENFCLIELIKNITVPCLLFQRGLNVVEMLLELWYTQVVHLYKLFKSNWIHHLVKNFWINSTKLPFGKDFQIMKLHLALYKINPFNARWLFWGFSNILMLCCSIAMVISWYLQRFLPPAWLYITMNF